ncbi:leucine-rich repeat domain-containing protein [Roseburia sp. 499]|uniref:leucine-rich repeat domain-containing protein n=1 Tax=Roseburia sp. 499 TaxID=1261634 RepID=UPI000953427A|nr:leucine-rich repeat domain-containing protein [Roseburia sp. 499]WVK70308.1 leucine-rich repeat domain-containing protein [Roseburia sp. 499]
MKKRIGIGCIILIVITGVVITSMVLNDDSKKNTIEDITSGVAFEDEAMKALIAETAEVEPVDELHADDLEKVESLNIGYTGYYDTLLDVVKCQKLERLVIGDPEYAFCHYHRKGKEIPGPESKERMEQIESELEVILEKCPNIKTLCISNEEGNCELNSLDFLKNGDGVTLLYIEYQPEMDYSILLECKNLKSLSLYESDISEWSVIGELSELSSLNIAGTNVSEAEEILKLKNLKYLNINNTPLAENEEQLALIYQQFSDIDIYTGEDDLGN